MRARRDITGERFGRLVAQERIDSNARGQSRWRLLCDCGQSVVLPLNNIRSGNTSSCGCLKSGTMPVSVPLTKGYSVLVDERDLTWIKGFNWYAHDTGRNIYARTTSPRKIYMHEIIMGSFVDHKNGNTLDNRRCNLRKADKRLNSANSKKREGTTSPYKGVSWNKAQRRWVVQVAKRCVGFYDNPEEAARVYDAEAIKAFGEFARLNFPVQEVSDGQF